MLLKPSRRRAQARRVAVSPCYGWRAREAVSRLSRCAPTKGNAFRLVLSERGSRTNNSRCQPRSMP
jgi:hypothetical protein